MFLTIKSVSVRFGGLWAVKDVSFPAEQGAITAVIGPNGAGKSTLFNVISGFVAPTEGVVSLDGTVVSGRAPEAIAKNGIGRTFQTPEICRDMSVVDNALVGAHQHVKGGLFGQMLSLGAAKTTEAAARVTAREELQTTNLWDLRDMPAGALPLGKVRLLEIARALVSKPRLVLLDEPASGLNSQEAIELAELTRQMRRRGITVLLIEHNVSFVMRVADRIAVLDNGRLLFVGSPEEVRNDQTVIEAYLGRQRA